MSTHSHSSQSSNRKEYEVTSKYLTSLISDWVKCLRKEILKLKRWGEKHLIKIPGSVCYNGYNVSIDYEDLLDCCYQRHINHLLIFMRDHWMLTAISPWHDTVFWLDSTRDGDAIPKLSRVHVNE